MNINLSIFSVYSLSSLSDLIVSSHFESSLRMIEVDSQKLHLVSYLRTLLPHDLHVSSWSILLQPFTSEPSAKSSPLAALLLPSTPVSKEAISLVQEFA